MGQLSDGDVLAKVGPKVGRAGWNTVQLGGAVPDDEVLELIDASYETVVAKLPKRQRPTAGG